MRRLIRRRGHCPGYYSDEFTYYNAIAANYVKMSYEEQKKFEVCNQIITLEKYKSYSIPIKGNTRFKDAGYNGGYGGYRLNFLGALIKLLEDLPEKTLIERGVQKRINKNIEKLFAFHSDYIPDFDYKMGIGNGFLEASEYETFQVLANRIIDLCAAKEIYFDINPYSEILLFKEPIEIWIDTLDIYSEMNIRHHFTKYEDTYIDGHVDSHEETQPVEIKERMCISHERYFLDRKHDRIKEIYDVTYVDGVRGKVYTEYTEYTD